MNSQSLNYLPKFSEIDPSKVEKQISACLEKNRKIISHLLDKPKTHFTWENLIYPLDDLDEELQRLWSPVSHLNSVVSNDYLRAAYHACLPKITEYSTELGQNEKLYQAVKSIADSPEYQKLDSAQKTAISHMLRDFRLAGIALSEEKKQQYKELQLKLSKAMNTFEDNLLDATNAWHKHITDPNLLKGLPENALQAAKEQAVKKGINGWLLTLEFPCYDAIMRYADNQELRKEIYTAFVTRASEQGPHDKKWDNSTLMMDILALRQELAQLLGFANFAEYSLVSKMVDTPQQAKDFLIDLAKRGHQQAQLEFKELQNFAHEQYNVDTLNAWDLAYYSEKLKQHRYAISSEALRPYFPENKVIEGMFTIVNRLFGIRLEEVKEVDRWHPDVKFFNVIDEKGQLRGHLYMDLYARAKKRGGAWMDHYVGRRLLQDGTHQLPIAFLTCNFASPSKEPGKEKPALFSYEEVETLFHEFGHCLHHLLTKIDYPHVAGINGVPWDAVELPSQFLEFWCGETETLPIISGHYQTGEKLPEEMIIKLRKAKNFQSAMQLMRQLEFSLFDLRIHTEDSIAKHINIQQILNEVRQQVAVVPIPIFNRFQHSFSHIFAGGYAAGYYSYKWAEVLASDAFAKFEEEGILNHDTGRAFLHSILEQGGAADPLTLFINFRGREPKIDALLKHTGIKN